MALPTFELVTFSNVDELRATLPIPDPLAHELSGVGVPRDFLDGIYWANERLDLFRRSDGSRLIHFGTSRLWDPMMCVDPETGHVVEIWDGSPAQMPSSAPEWIEGFVNSSLDHFRRSVEAVTNRFPFYSREDGGLEIRTAASEDVRSLVEAIDPPAAEPDQFWSTLADDIAIGDFETEAFIGVRFGSASEVGQVTFRDAE